MNRRFTSLHTKNNKSNYKQVKFKIMKKTVLLTFSALLAAHVGYGQFNGELDSNYAQNGVSLIDFNSQEQVGVSAKFHPNGKLYYGGVAGGPNNDFLLTRLNQNGTIDNAFGNQGAMTYDFSLGGDDYMYDMDIFPDGKILMAGMVAGNGKDQVISVINPDGTYQTAFNQTGFLVTGGSYKDRWQTCLAEPNGKVLVAGITSNAIQQDITLERYNADGSPDNTFGILGNVSFDFSDWETAVKLHRHSSSVYYLLMQTNDYKFSIFGFDQWGQALPNFKNGGTLNKTMSNTGNLILTDLITDAQGNLYVIGSFKDAPADYKALVYKFDNTGAIDSSFGVNGQFLANLSSSNRDYLTAGKVLSNGNLLLSGMTTIADQNMMTFQLAPDGTLIFNYGQNGLMEYDVINQKIEVGSYIAEDNNGKIFLYGSSVQQATQIDMAVLKLKTVDANVGLAEMDENLSLEHYPNPVSDNLTIDISKLSTRNVEIEIFDLRGNLVYKLTEVAANPRIVVDLSPLPRGLYLTRVAGGQQKATFKVQKL